jgi:hypothetical protein
MTCGYPVLDYFVEIQVVERHFVENQETDILSKDTLYVEAT